MFKAREYYIVYNQKPENKKRSRELQKIYRQQPEVKQKHNEYSKEYYLKNKEKIKNYQKNYQESNKQNINQKRRQTYNTNIEYKKRKQEQYNTYLHTKKGKMAIAKRNNKRKRNLKTIILINNAFPKEINIEYHHINKLFVVPLPKITHRYINGTNKNKSHIKHNEIWIKKLYCIDVKLFLEQ